MANVLILFFHTFASVMIKSFFHDKIGFHYWQMVCLIEYLPLKIRRSSPWQ